MQFIYSAIQSCKTDQKKIFYMRIWKIENLKLWYQLLEFNAKAEALIKKKFNKHEDHITYEHIA